MPETYETFADWRRAVNRLMLKHLGLTLDDLPDLTFPRDAFEAGTTPETFFHGQVRDVCLEEFGADVAELWPEPSEDGRK